MKVIAKQDTVVKKYPKQSSDIADDKKFSIKVGKEYPIEELKSAPNNHWLITLGYGAGEWYFYKPHVEIEKPEDINERESAKRIIDAGNGYKVNEIVWDDFDSPVSKYFTVGEVAQFSLSMLVWVLYRPVEW